MRIVKNSEGHFEVQARCLGFLWWTNILERPVSCYFGIPAVFDSVEEAEKAHNSVFKKPRYEVIKKL